MSRHPDLSTVASLDLSRYLGTWYEIARLPIRFEDADCTDVSAHYSLDADGGIRPGPAQIHADQQGRDGQQ